MDDSLTPGRRQIPYLTGVRGLAALMIVAEHAANNYFYFYYKSLTYPFSYLAMALFFVLSGFVLSMNYMDRLASPQRRVAIADFFVARFARLYPLYGVVIILCLCAVSFESLMHPWLVVLSFVTLTQSWFNQESPSLNAFSPRTFGNEMHITWSISTETFAYLFLPVLALFLTRKCTVKKLWCTYAATVLGGFGASYLFYVYGNSLLKSWPFLRSGNPDVDREWICYTNPYLCFFDFLTGCVAAKLYLYPGALLPKKFSSRALSAIALATCFGAIVVIIAYKIHHPGSLTYFPFVIHNFAFVPFISLILLIMGRNAAFVTRFFEMRWMLNVGKLSYSLYMVHFLAFMWIPVYHPGGYGDFTTRPSFMASALLTLAAITLSYILAHASYTFIEVPWRKWIREKWIKSSSRSQCTEYESL